MSPAATVGDVIRLWHELAGPSTPNLKFEAEEWDGEWNNRGSKDMMQRAERYFNILQSVSVSVI